MFGAFTLLKTWIEVKYHCNAVIAHDTIHPGYWDGGEREGGRPFAAVECERHGGGGMQGG